MKIDNDFFEQRWVKAIRAEFGAQGVLAVIKLLSSIYDSGEGYWSDWSAMDKAILAGESGMTVGEIDELMVRLAEYGVIDRNKLEKERVVTSSGIQQEYIRQAGVARARRQEWKKHCLLSLQQLLEAGVAPVLYDRPPDEEYGVPMPICRMSPHLYPGFRQVRLRHPDPRIHIYRVIRC